MLRTDEEERIEYDDLGDCAFADIGRKEFEAFMMIPARSADEENNGPSKLCNNVDDS